MAHSSEHEDVESFSRAAEAFNAGNAAAQRGDDAAAIARYGQAIEIEPRFPHPYYNRALARSRTGREDAALRDLVAAARAGFDEGFFYDTWARHQSDHGGFRSVFALCDSVEIPAHQRHRLEQELDDQLQHAHFLLTEVDATGLGFSPDSLELRCLLADLLAVRFDPEPALVERVLELTGTDPLDLEATWRAQLVIGLLYGSVLLSPFEAIDDGVGLFVDDSQMALAFAIPPDRVAALDRIAHGGRAGPSEDRNTRFARFGLVQLGGAAETLLEARQRRPSIGSAGAAQWAIVDDLWRNAVELAVLLEDAAACGSLVGQARLFGVLVDSARWFAASASAEQAPAVRRRLAETYDAGPAGIQSDEGTLEAVFFTYEKATDTIVRADRWRGGTALHKRRLAPDEVVEVQRIGHQWEDAADVRAEPGPVDPIPAEIRRDVFRAVLADSDVPSDRYPDWVDDLLLGGLELDGVDRLVIVPWGYLHNVPMHLLPTIRRAIDRDRLREVVLMPFPGAPDPSSRALDRATARMLYVAVGADLDAVAIETEAIASLFPNATVLLGEDARPERVLDVLEAVDVAHFACHGGFDSATGAAFVQLHDGRLYPADLLTIGTAPRLVFLNACVTGVVERAGRNADAAMSLPAAFLVSGTAEVIGTLWRIDDASAAEFACRFLRRWVDEPNARAAELVLAIQREMSLEPAFADMYLWGAHSIWARHLGGA